MKNSTTIIVLAAALGMVATPAFAAPQGRFGDATVTLDAKTGKYCFSQPITGSRIPVRQCRTKAEWAQAGLTITHQAKIQLARK